MYLLTVSTEDYFTINTCDVKLTYCKNKEFYNKKTTKKRVGKFLYFGEDGVSGTFSSVVRPRQGIWYQTGRDRIRYDREVFACSFVTIRLLRMSDHLLCHVTVSVHLCLGRLLGKWVYATDETDFMR